MSYVRNIRIILLPLVITSLLGCAVDQDRADARAIADRVHSQIQAGDFSSIYKESAPRFKTVGSESQFVSRMQQFSEGSGKFKKADESAYQTSVNSNTGRMYTLNFNVEFERGHAQERLIFTRSDNGQMQLWKLDIYPTDF